MPNDFDPPRAWPGATDDAPRPGDAPPGAGGDAPLTLRNVATRLLGWLASRLARRGGS